MPLRCHFPHFEITVNGNATPNIILQTKGKEWCSKDWLNKENIIFLWLGRVSKTGRILSENGRPEIFTETRRFPAKKGGLEFLFLWPFGLK